MKLSIIIVSYKVPYFLEQTLRSVQQATQQMLVETIVVDNKSEDGTIAMLQEKFPEVLVIANKKNTGFATANNQGIAIAKGEYILFLNPDTVLREDTLACCIQFMQENPSIGGLGVHMIDGSGNFLPESKRGFPSPAVAFYKTFGLSTLFPKSKRFNQYHLGYLDKAQNHAVDVLSGAFMLLPRTVLEEVGYWDESFFMYGEDIDLSYRIIKAGYQNYYLADTTIIHYKGESTKKGSLNYVKTFYEAMIIFAQKHFEGSKASTFILMLKGAIYFRAILTLVANLFKKISLPITDAFLIYGGLVGIKNVWEVIRFSEPTYYDVDVRLVYFNFPIYVLSWVFCTYLRGGYDQLARHRHLITGVGLGTLVIATFYAFLPQELRFSRMLILLGTLWTVVAMYTTRSLQSWMRAGTIFWSHHPPLQVAIVGEVAESKRVYDLLHQSGIDFKYRGQILPNESEEIGQAILGSVSQIGDLVEMYDINELIFCGKDIPHAVIMKNMQQMGKKLSYKIVPQYSNYIIGSSSKNTAGELYTMQMSFKISNSIRRRNKRVLDIVYTTIFLVLLPVVIFIVKDKIGFLSNMMQTILGKRTWVGYYPHPQNNQLPNLKTAILTPVDKISTTPDIAAIYKMNFFYAKDYSSRLDWQIITKAIPNLGRTTF